VEWQAGDKIANTTGLSILIQADSKDLNKTMSALKTGVAILRLKSIFPGNHT
jgi:hypothetical protein